MEKLRVSRKRQHRKLAGGIKATCSHRSDSTSDIDLDKVFMDSMKNYCRGRGCRHKGAPEPKPAAVCFYMRKSSCSHVEIKQYMEELLPLSPGAQIVSIQYVPLYVHLDTEGGDIRWVVTLNSVEARNRISGSSIRIKGQRVTIRRYDDIIHLEYRKCSRSTNVQTVVHKIQNLDKKITELKL